MFLERAGGGLLMLLGGRQEEVDGVLKVVRRHEEAPVDPLQRFHFKGVELFRRYPTNLRPTRR